MGTIFLYEKCLRSIPGIDSTYAPSRMILRTQHVASLWLRIGHDRSFDSLRG